MAFSALRVPILPWLQGYDSPQLDFVAGLTQHDPAFEQVVCKFYCDRFIHSLWNELTRGCAILCYRFFRLFLAKATSCRLRHLSSISGGSATSMSLQILPLRSGRI